MLNLEKKQLYIIIAVVVVLLILFALWWYLSSSKKGKKDKIDEHDHDHSTKDDSSSSEDEYDLDEETDVESIDPVERSQVSATIQGTYSFINDKQTGGFAVIHRNGKADMYKPIKGQFQKYKTDYVVPAEDGYLEFDVFGIQESLETNKVSQYVHILVHPDKAVTLRPLQRKGKKFQPLETKNLIFKISDYPLKPEEMEEHYRQTKIHE